VDLSDYEALNAPETRRAVERAGGFFVVEGPLAIAELLSSGYRVRSVLASSRAEARARALLGPRDVPLHVLPQDQVDRLTGFHYHRGLLASADRRPLPDPAEVTAGATRVAVLEGLNDHENLGAVFRNARAFGVGAVVLDPTAADPLYRRSVRVSQGHVLRVPWARAADWPGELDRLRAEGFTVLALTPDRTAPAIEVVAADPPPRVAFLLGAEGPGLSPAARSRADLQVRIPTADEVDSLNVATAAAIAFHRLRSG
jgi:tRNA G18 (ribose-2'-O)-methylase SpoU